MNRPLSALLRPSACAALALVIPVIVSAADERPAPLRYVRAGKAAFVLESLVSEAVTKEGRTYTSLTDRGKEKMTLTLRFDASNKLTRAEAVQETPGGKQTVTVVFGRKEAVLTRAGVSRRRPPRSGGTS